MHVFRHTFASFRDIGVNLRRSTTELFVVFFFHDRAGRLVHAKQARVNSRRVIYTAPLLSNHGARINVAVAF